MINVVNLSTGAMLKGFVLKLIHIIHLDSKKWVINGYIQSKEEEEKKNKTIGSY